MIRRMAIWLWRKRRNEFCYCDVIWNMVCFCVFLLSCIRGGGVERRKKETERFK
jgi:hypothetical protein